MKTSLRILVLALCVVLAAPCLAQGRMGPGIGMPDPTVSTQPRVTISIFPGVAFPAFETGEDVVAAAVGGGIAVGYNFFRGRAVGIGFDVSGSFGITVDEGSGNWIGTSIGLPLRLGSRGPSLLIRPGFNLDRLDYHVGDSFSSLEADWNGSMAFGVSLLLGLEINSSRFGFGFFGSFEYLFAPHEGDEWHYGAYVGDLVGRYTLQAGIRFTIRL